jgi:hypothetical protein
MDSGPLALQVHRHIGDVVSLKTLAAWELALHQRAFGEDRLVVATAGRDGHLLGLAHCPMSDPPEMGLNECLRALDFGGPVAAVAYSDEPVERGIPADPLLLRFFRARAAAADQGIHLVDWITCGRKLIRSLKYAAVADAPWWDLPAAPVRSDAPPGWDNRSLTLA